MKTFILIIFLILPASCFAGGASGDWGDYSPDSSALTDVKTKFVDRWSSFTTEVKTSSLFSLVNFSNVSLSGTPVYSFEAGGFGGHIDFDFSTVFGDFALYLLKSIVLVLSTYAAITHVLKGGA